MTFLGAVAAIELAFVWHEVGHIVAAQRFGFKFRGLSVNLRHLGVGAKLVREPEQEMTREEKLLIRLGGPAASIIFALAFGLNGRTSIALWSTALGLLCLIPVGESDGTRALRVLRNKES
jgi:Zn-dependent protease